jgi:predicted Zn-dependent protease
MKKLSIILFSMLIAGNISGQKANYFHMKDDRIKQGKLPACCKDVDYSCLITDPFAQGAYLTHMSETEAVKMAPGEVSAQEENDFGDQMFEQYKSQSTFLTNDKLNMLNGIMNTLINKRPADHSQLKYTIHLIDDPTVNAFTAGGHIFVYTGIFNYCKTVSEMAFIIAHEIGHNEKGHINLILKRIKVAGEYGNMLYSIKQMTTASFNQFNELEADCYAADLCYAAGFNPCVGAEFWKRMAADNSENPSMFDKFLRSHPYSLDRYTCLKSHLEKYSPAPCN